MLSLAHTKRRLNSKYSPPTSKNPKATLPNTSPRKKPKAKNKNKIVKKANNVRINPKERADSKPAALSMAINFHNRNFNPA